MKKSAFSGILSFFGDLFKNVVKAPFKDKNDGDKTTQANNGDKK